MGIIDSIAVVVGYIAIVVIAFFAVAYICLFLWLWLSRSIVTYIAILKVDKRLPLANIVKPELKNKSFWKVRLLFLMLGDIYLGSDVTRTWTGLEVRYKGLGVSYTVYGDKK